MFIHIIIRVLYFQFHSAVPILLIEIGCRLFHQLLTALENSHIVIPNDIVQLCQFGPPLQPVQMIEPLPVLCTGRVLKYGEHGMKLHSQKGRVAQNPLGIASMGSDPVNGHLRRGRIKVFIF